MGVLKALVGGVWTKVGCDTPADPSGYTSSADIGWNTGTSPDPALEWTGGYQMQPQLLRDMPSGSYYEVRQRPVNTVTGVRGAWTQEYANFGPFSLTFSYPHDFLGYFQGGSPFGTDEVLGDVEVRYATASSASGDGALLATWHHGVTVPGRLRLWTGSGWVREACDEELPFTDDYNRPDSALSGPYQFLGTGTWSVDTNVAKASGVSGFALAVVDRGVEVADAQVDLTALSGGSPYTGGAGLVWNVVDANNFYMWHIIYSSSSVYRVVAGTLNPISALSGPNNGVSGTGTYRVTHTAAGLITLRKGGSVLVTDGSHSLVAGGTKEGIVSNDTAPTARFDNLLLPASAVAHPLKIEDPANPGTWITVACMVPVL